MEWLIIWKLSKSFTKCDSPCVQKNPIVWCSLFGSPSGKADEMLMIWNLMQPLIKCDNPCVQKNHTGCSLFGSPSSEADGVAHMGAVYLALHPVRQMEWPIIWKLSKSLTKCDSPCVQKNPIMWCSLFGSPSSKADEMLMI
jgi:hypothetical protein